MFPILLDIRSQAVAVIGHGEQAARRLQLLDDAGAVEVRVFAPEPAAPLAEAAGDRLQRRFPEGADLEGLAAVFIGDLPLELAEPLAALARQYGALVNTEDVRHLCDFHVPALVRRGDLLVTVSTGGKSPGLARRLRRALEAFFDPQWEDRLNEVAELRDAWRREGLSPKEIGERTDTIIEQRGWLS